MIGLLNIQGQQVVLMQFISSVIGSYVGYHTRISEIDDQDIVYGSIYF